MGGGGDGRIKGAIQTKEKGGINPPTRPFRIYLHTILLC